MSWEGFDISNDFVKLTKWQHVFTWIWLLEFRKDPGSRACQRGNQVVMKKYKQTNQKRSQTEFIYDMVDLLDCYISGLATDI